MTPGDSGRAAAALRDLPSIDRLLRAPGANELLADFGRAPATDALRATLAAVSYTHLDVYKRQSLNNGRSGSTSSNSISAGSPPTLW